ncbi:thioredoxin family protein [Tenacibaculum xiamenense]|uniref:thioredoxin family protein n=1 Tax=Tenacibaculum xiamenense TaxID=1261553 RepID=UPI003895A088
MKLITAFFISLFFIFQIQAQDSAETIMNKAMQKAKKEKKNILLKYGASWCTWCKKMDQKIKSPTCKDLFEKNYVIVNLTVFEPSRNKHLENPGASDLLEKQNGKTAGLPFWVILDSKGKVLEDCFNSSNQNLGCPKAPSEIQQFIDKIKRTSKLSQKELEIITAEFKSRH